MLFEGKAFFKNFVVAFRQRKNCTDGMCIESAIFQLNCCNLAPYKKGEKYFDTRANTVVVKRIIMGICYMACEICYGALRMVQGFPFCRFVCVEVCTTKLYCTTLIIEMEKISGRKK